SRVNRPGDFIVPFEIPDVAFGRSTRLIDWNLQQPRMVHYNVAVERELPFDMAVSVAYAGSRGYNLVTTTEGNPTIPQTLPDGRVYWTGAEERINPAWDTMELKIADGRSWYNSLQLKVNKRMSRGLQFQGSFTWAKTEDTGSTVSGQDTGGTQHQGRSNVFDLEFDKGPAVHDVRYNFRFSMIYGPTALLPPASVAGKILNGWQIASIVTLTSGQPFTVALGTNRSRSQTLNGPSGLERPDLVPGVRIEDVTSGVSRGCGSIPAGTPVGTPELWYDPCAFAIPAAGTLGNVGSNSLRLPGYATVDLSLVKRVPLGEVARLELRGEVFNLLNRANFGVPDRIVYVGRNDVGAPVSTAGQISSAGRARQVQLAVRFVF
ncbi:MAG: hypothetical protein ABIG68_09495, partial [Acidobacteriota bacterium]